MFPTNEDIHRDIKMKMINKKFSVCNMIREKLTYLWEHGSPTAERQLNYC